MERNIPEISVIVPVYNVEQYLAECISSILSQTFTDFELLLVDDGSPDRCGEICDEYAGKDKRVRVFHQENAGLSCARNKGLKHASGTYIAFVDSDDYVTSTYLQELYASLPADKSQRGTVICGFDKLFPDGSLHTVHVPQQTISPMDCSRVLTELVGKYVMYAWAKLYDNRLIKEYGIRFVPAVSGLEDMLFMLDYLPYSDYLLIRDTSTYIYRVGYSMATLSNIAQTELRAPFDGVIGLRQVSVGTYASPSTIVAKLTKLSPLKVEFAVPERYANDVKTGAGLDFTLEGKLNTFHATVYARESKIDPTTHTLTIRALYPNANSAVLPGRYASIKLNKDEIQNALAVPSEAIVPEMGKDKIFLYKSGKAQPVEITTGIRTEAEVQVLQGLNIGDTIITSGTLQLRTGLPVTLDNIN